MRHIFSDYVFTHYVVKKQFCSRQKMYILFFFTKETNHCILQINKTYPHCCVWILGNIEPESLLFQNNFFKLIYIHCKALKSTRKQSQSVPEPLALVLKFFKSKITRVCWWYRLHGTILVRTPVSRQKY